MKISFDDRLEAIEWIAEYVQDEGQFEVLREQLLFNFIYHQKYFLELDDEASLAEVVPNRQS